MSIRPRTALLALPVVTLALALGCGGDTSEAPAPGVRAKAKAKTKAGADRARSRAKAPAAKAPGAKGPGGEAGRDKRLAERLTFADQEGRTTPLVSKADLPDDAPRLVSLIVMDTLRGDRTHLCGAEVPNTPVLDALKPRAAVTCDAYSPAAWTLPSHASYFTGEPTAAHGVHTLGVPLAPRFDTLAEHYQAAGYQTVFISANPVFNKPAGGFWQGFDRVVVAKGLVGPLRSRSFAGVIDQELDRIDTDKPLFLVVNIFDAHDPYPAVPPGLDWAEPQPRTNLHPHTADPTNPYYQFVTGGMEAEDQPGYLARIRNGYDHAVRVADANLGQLLKHLKTDGWLDEPLRMVITSDHGEHLGEHGLLRHGSATWQTVTRVPFLYLDHTPSPPLELPPLLSATASYHLLKDGALPDPLPLVESASGHNADDFKPSWVTVSVWPSPTEKLMVFDGDPRRYDLAADPMETEPLPIPDDHPMKPVLDRQLERHDASIAEALEAGTDPEVMEMLREVGYVQ